MAAFNLSLTMSFETPAADLDSARTPPMARLSRGPGEDRAKDRK